MVIQVGSTELTGLTKEAHDLYHIQIGLPDRDFAVPSGLLRELSKRYVHTHVCS